MATTAAGTEAPAFYDLDPHEHPAGGSTMVTPPN